MAWGGSDAFPKYFRAKEWDALPTFPRLNVALVYLLRSLIIYCRKKHFLYICMSVVYRSNSSSPGSYYSYGYYCNIKQLHFQHSFLFQFFDSCHLSPCCPSCSLSTVWKLFLSFANVFTFLRTITLKYTTSYIQYKYQY